MRSLQNGSQQAKAALQISMLISSILEEMVETHEAMDEMVQPDGSVEVANDETIRELDKLNQMLREVLSNSRSSVVDTFETLNEETQEMVNDFAPEFISWTER